MTTVSESTPIVFSNSSPVTVVLTSCGRPDLLRKTLDSFFKYNSFPLKKFIITEDSGIPNINKDVKAAYPNITYIDGLTRVGQIESIDRAYKQVDTPYIFHLEEDWEIYKSGFIEESLEILKTNSKVSAVMCVPHDFKYKPDPNNPGFLYCPGSDRWGCYTFNPGLRRLSDYQNLGPFSSITAFRRDKPVKSEKAVNNRFRRRGLHMAITTDPAGYIRHIGDGRHVSP